MSQSTALPREQFFYYTVQFFIKSGDTTFTHVFTGRKEELVKVCEGFKADDKIESVIAVYVCSISATDTSPVVVKRLKEENNNTEVKE